MSKDKKKIEMIVSDNETYEHYYRKAVKKQSKGSLDTGYASLLKDMLNDRNLDGEKRKRLENLLRVVE